MCVLRVGNLILIRIDKSRKVCVCAKQFLAKSDRDNKMTFFSIDMYSNGQMSRRSLKTNHQNPNALQGLSDGIKNFVVPIIKESVESYCVSPGKVCVAGPPGPKGIEGSRGERGPKGSTGIKGQKGIQK